MATNQVIKLKRGTSTPTTSNIASGEVAVDTSAQKLYINDSGTIKELGTSEALLSSSTVAIKEFEYTASGSQTTFSGNDSAGNSLSYDSPFIDCYLNGVKLVNGTDVTVTSGNSVVLASGAASGDILDLVAFGTFNVAAINAANITAGTMGTARLPTIPTTKGGTGLTSIGSANQVIRVNSGANGLEFADVPGFGGILGVSDGGTGLGSLGSAGQVMKVNSGGSALEFGNASSAEVYGFNMSYSPSTINYTVAVQAVSGSNKYFILGEQQKTLELFEGNTYVFTHPSAHPLRFSTDSGNSSAYTTGVTVNSSTQVTIVVASGAPTLYYYCSSHSGMGGQANTPVPANNNLQVTTTNQGSDNITNTQYAAFDDVLFSASGFTFSLSNGSLIATI